MAELETETGDYYKGELHSNVVRRTDAYTLIAVDTRCDGNILLIIFDNTKEQK